MLRDPAGTGFHLELVYEVYMGVVVVFASVWVRGLIWGDMPKVMGLRVRVVGGDLGQEVQ